MKAVKANKEYTIDEGSKSFYKNQGFDIYEDDGSLIEYGVGKTVSYAEHKKVLDELEELKAGSKEVLDELEELKAGSKEVTPKAKA